MAKKTKKSREARTTQESPISLQVSIIGPGASHLTRKLSQALVEDRLADDFTGPFQVRIKLWRSGEELDWEQGGSRADNLREMIRRLLPSVQFRAEEMGSE